MPRSLRPARFGHAEVFALIGLSSFLVARFAPVLDLSYRCPFRLLTGLPCASCGMTHAFVHLAQGDLGAALAANPLGAILALAAWAFAALDLARVAAGLPLPRLGTRTVRVFATVGAAAVLLNWGWLLRAGAGK